MKKTVQIVTVPLDKKDNAPFFKKDDLVLRKVLGGPNLEPMIKFKIIDKNQIALARLQQLLVLSDDEIGLSDIDKIVKYPFGIGKTIEHGGNHGIEVECITCTMFYNPNNVTAGTKARFSPEDVYQIIASYPQIDSGTPGEGSVEIEHETIARASGFETGYDYFKIDELGNLLLEFGKEKTLEEVMDNVFANWADTDRIAYELLEKATKQPTTHTDFTIDALTSNTSNRVVTTNFDINKPSIPTDEEIREKAQEYTRSITLGYIDTDLKGLEDIRTETTDAFETGYKQALKDLGHE
jgi:hypothetical protein